MKKLFIILFVALVGFASTSCDDYLDVNKNQDAPDKVDAKQLEELCIKVEIPAEE